MKIIGIAALAFALAAFAARAQTDASPGQSDNTATTTKPNSQTTEDKGTATLPADQNSSALPGNSSNTATSNSSLPSNSPAANPAQPADTGAKLGQTQPDDSSNKDSSSSDVKPPKHNKKVKKRSSAAQGRSEQGSMHRKPATPSTTGDAKGPAKDPGMSSHPGDVTGQPTDTQKPVDTAPSSTPPKDK